MKKCKPAAIQVDTTTALRALLQDQEASSIRLALARTCTSINARSSRRAKTPT